jgi:dethiobiotin synthetase
MKKRYFITGTDTGVGKTIAAAALARYFPQCGVCKPVQTGYPADQDLKYIAKTAGLKKSQIYNPLHFSLPLAPQQACAQDRLPPIDVKELTRAIASFCDKFAVSLIEGAGGLYVPLRRNYYMLNLIKDLRAEAVLVCRTGLGTVNHTLLSVSVLRRKRLKIRGLIFNQTEPPDLSAQLNPHIVQEATGLPILGIFPYQKKLNPAKFELRLA